MKGIALLGCVAMLCTGAAWAAGAAAPGVTASPPATAHVKPLSAQQERMKSCNGEAGTKQLKGEERKAFMSSCLKGS